MTLDETNRLNAWLDSLVPIYNPDGRLPVTREEAGMLYLMEHVRHDVLEWVRDQLPPGANLANIFYGGFAMDMLRELLGQPALDPRTATWVNYRDNPTARDAAQQRMFEQMLAHMPQQGTTMTIDTTTVRSLASDLVGATYGGDVLAALRRVVEYAASVGITAAGAQKADITKGLPDYLIPITVKALKMEGGRLVPDPFLFAAAGVDDNITLPPGLSFRPHWFETGRFADMYNGAYADGAILDNLYWIETAPGAWARRAFYPADWKTIATRITELPAVKAKWTAEIPAALARIPA